MKRLVPLALILSCTLPGYTQEDTPPPPPAEEPGDQGGEGGDAPGEDAPGEDAKGEDEGLAEERAADDARLLDTLRELLVAEPQVKNGRVTLVYTFRDAEQLEDWESNGFQRAEQTNARGKIGRRRGRNPNAKPGKNASLALATSRAGLLTHKVPFVNDVEVEITCHMERGATRSDLVLGVGKAGVRFGQVFVKRSGSGFKTVDRPFSEENPYSGGARATLKLKADAANFSATVGKGGTQTTSKLREKNSGKVYLYTTQAHLIVHQVKISGVVDEKQLR